VFETLSNRLSAIFDKLRGRGFLSEEDISLALREIRIAILEADVALSATKVILEKVKERALGKEVLKSVTPGQMIIKFVHEELIDFLGSDVVPLDLKANSPFSFMLVGLQGSGKTTSSAKLANVLKNTHKILLVSLDVYRPAAQEQLSILARSINVESLEIIKDELPLKIAERAIMQAKKNSTDIIIFDTAGRTHINDEMMAEINDLQKLINPVEILLVADAMMGQDATNVAKSFKERVSLTGLILTRVDGDARGGAAISMRYITNCPIKFLGVGEHVDKLIPFSPKRIADQILDRGDIVELVEKAAQLAEKTSMEKMQKRIEKGKFDMNDMKEQLEQIVKIGGFSGFLNMLPGAKKIRAELEKKSQSFPEESVIKRQIAFIQSMTKKERLTPDILNGSRRKRIAAGAGQSVMELNRFLKKFETTKDMVKRASKNKNPEDFIKMLNKNGNFL
jgi:signal recognition particle subunit SRP54